MFDKNVVKYVNMNDMKASGRQVGGKWQSEFTVTGHTEKELLDRYDFMIGELNKINNKYNAEIEKKKTSTSKVVLNRKPDVDKVRM